MKKFIIETTEGRKFIELAQSRKSAKEEFQYRTGLTIEDVELVETTASAVDIEKGNYELSEDVVELLETLEEANWAEDEKVEETIPEMVESTQRKLERITWTLHKELALKITVNSKSKVQSDLESEMANTVSIFYGNEFEVEIDKNTLGIVFRTTYSNQLIDANFLKTLNDINYTIIAINKAIELGAFDNETKVVTETIGEGEAQIKNVVSYHECVLRFIKCNFNARIETLISTGTAQLGKSTYTLV
jgi:hypothetical protein